MEEERWLSRRAQIMKVKDPLFLAAMFGMAGIGIVVGLSQGDSANDTLVFVIFAMSMLYLAVR